MRNLIFFALFVVVIVAQSSRDAAVNLSAVRGDYGNSLYWTSVDDATSVIIQRKAPDEVFWSTIGSPAVTDTFYPDLDSESDEIFEYGITISGSINSYGYILSGNAIPPVHNRGRLMLIIEDRFEDVLQEEILRFEQDLVGDGWKIETRYVSADDSPEDIRDEIALYWSTELDVEAVILLGHVPVPYSGRLNPDGHGNHIGAWPADVYYGDPAGGYSDAYINDTTASREANWNIPGDGKWDQTVIPGNVELMVGRIDFSNMPAFDLSDTLLLAQYLDRDHVYRMAEIQPRKRALIDDNFGYFSGEAFAASGYRAAFALVGSDSTFSGDFRTDLADSTGYLYAYGCGGGSYTSASGIGNTTDMAAAVLNAPFTGLFGSYFGDWDVQNSFLRSPLAAEGWVLTCSWSGRPNHYHHQMAMGYPVGYGFRASQNNSSTYISGYSSRYIHSALMGDPTVRAHYFQPAQGLVADIGDFGFDVLLRWLPSPDTAVTKYHVYAGMEFGDYIHIGETEDTAYVWNAGIAGMQHYMIRAERLETSPNGCYANLSQGIFDSVMVTGIDEAQTPAMLSLNAWPNPFNSVLHVDFDGTEPVEVFDVTGSRIMLIEAGRNRIDFANRPAGLYILRTTVDGRQAEKKVLLVK